MKANKHKIEIFLLMSKYWFITPSKIVAGIENIPPMTTIIKYICIDPSTSSFSHQKSDQHNIKNIGDKTIVVPQTNSIYV